MSLESVKVAVESMKDVKIDILILNAGIMIIPEKVFAVRAAARFVTADYIGANVL
jgi:NADP-dependent 3-hydroxy acid dehydrogenase YdfG